MKRKLGIILLVALAIEAVNFPAGAGYALDPGSSQADPWYMRLLGIEWGTLHAGGFFVLDVLERGNASPSALGALVEGSPRPVFMVPVRPPESRLESFLHNHPAVKLPLWGGLAVLLGGGYLSTVLVLLALTLGFSRFLRWKRKWSAGSATLPVSLEEQLSHIALSMTRPSVFIALSIMNLLSYASRVMDSKSRLWDSSTPAPLANFIMQKLAYSVSFC